MATIEERLAVIEARLGISATTAPAPAVDTVTPTLRGWEEIPAQFVAVGFSRDTWRLRPERYVGEPIGERMVSRGSQEPTGYLYDEARPAWANWDAWQAAGAPTTDKLGRLLDVRGRPIVGESKWTPER